MTKIQQAFTLIELLVVVAIIAVLLALLSPALDRAIYQAELAACGARLKALGADTITYAMANKRAYMERAITNNNPQPIHLRQNGANTENRIALGRAFNVNRLNDPLAQSVELSAVVPDFGVEGYKPQKNFEVFSTYNFFMGWHYTDRPAMRRIGDRFEWTFGGVTRRYNVLMSDRDLVMPSRNESQSSHPDRLGKMNNIVAGNEPSPWAQTAQDQAQQAFVYVTISLWRVQDTFRRGVVDDNFLYEDLAVARYNDVVADTTEDDRMSRIPIWQTNTTVPDTNGWIHLPKQ